MELDYKRMMSRKRVLFLWCIVVSVACYVSIAIMTNFADVRGNLRYMSNLNTFYRDISMRGFDRDLLISQRMQVQSSFQEMLPVVQNKNYSNTVDESPFLVVDSGGKLRKIVRRNEHDTTSKKKHANILDKLVVNKKLEEAYSTVRDERVNPFDFKFLEEGENICSGSEIPFALILCLTKYYDIETREAIRNTWGSIATTKQWPGARGSLPDVKLVFLFGSHEDSLVKNTILQDEKRRYGDIVAADFKDSYANLTYKVMMGLKWASEHCHQAKYVVKIDQDTFLHVVNLLQFLQLFPEYEEGVIIGYQNFNPKVMRTGKWAVDRRSFPLNNYPNYTNGNCYVISGHVVPVLIDAAEHMPYVFVEDAFITGIVRNALGIKLYNHKGFTKWVDKAPRLCGFHNDVRIAATNTDNDRKYNLWKALGYIHLRNCYDINKYHET